MLFNARMVLRFAALLLPTLAIGCMEVDTDDQLRAIPDGDDGGECKSHETELIARQHTDAGSITVSNDDDEVMIAVEADSPHLLADVQIYVGADPVPVDDSGIPSPDQFPFAIGFFGPVPAYELAVPLAELGVGCNELVDIAVHASVVSFDEQGNEVFSEVAWGFGDERFTGMRWGWSFDYGICCE